MSKHAILSPSGAHRWVSCPASAALQQEFPYTSSVYADEGTAAHELASKTLLSKNHTAADFIGQKVVINKQPWEFTPEMAEHVQTYVDTVIRLRDEQNGVLMVEERLPIDGITGEPGAAGTGDVVIVANKRLTIVDLKYGQGVQVDAEENEQLQIYGLAALQAFEFIYDIEHVRLLIVQPRKAHVSEWATTADALREFGARAGAAAKTCFDVINTYDATKAVAEQYYNPGDKQCQFCPAKGKCPALMQHVLTTVADDFVDLTQPLAPQLRDAPLRTMDNRLLGNAMSAVELVESWCKAIASQVRSELDAGRKVPGYKLVAGRKGSRAWDDKDAVDDVVQSLRLKKATMYTASLITPTAAAKLHKNGDLSDRQWSRLSAHITQADGKPTVVPESDKRPAIRPSIDEFDDLTQTKAA